MRGMKFPFARTTVIYVHNFRVVCQFSLQMLLEKAEYGGVTRERQTIPFISLQIKKASKPSFIITCFYLTFELKHSM